MSTITVKDGSTICKSTPICWRSFSPSNDPQAKGQAFSCGASGDSFAGMAASRASFLSPSTVHCENAVAYTNSDSALPRISNISALWFGGN